MPHADEMKPQPDLIGMMQRIDMGGYSLIVPQTMTQAAQLIEELRRHLARHEELMRALVEAVAPIVDEYNANKKRLYPGE